MNSLPLENTQPQNQKENIYNSRYKLVNRSFFLFLASLLRNLLRIVVFFFFYRIIIDVYGPTDHGLLALATNLASYANIVESGVGASVVVVLYGHFKRSQKHEINDILTAADRIFKLAACVYIVIAIALSLCAPLWTLKGGISNSKYWTFFFAILIITSLNLPGYLFGAKYDILLSADIRINRIYLINMVAMIFSFVPIFVLLSIPINSSVPFLLISALFASWFWWHNLFLMLFCKWKYPWVKKSTSPNYKFLNILKSAFVYRCIGILVANIAPLLITVFTTLNVRSGLALYNQMSFAIAAFTVAIANSILPPLGLQYKDSNVAQNKRAMNISFCFISFFALFAGLACYLLINSTMSFWYGVIYVQSPINLNAQLQSLLFSIFVFLSIFVAYEIDLLYFKGHFKKAIKVVITELAVLLVVLLPLLFFLENKIIAVFTAIIISYCINIIWLGIINNKIFLDNANYVFFLKLVLVFGIFLVCIGLSYLTLRNFSFFSNYSQKISSAMWYTFTIVSLITTFTISCVFVSLLNWKTFVWLYHVGRDHLKEMSNRRKIKNKK